MLNRKLSIVILAAGKGTRMHSDLPKALHLLAGIPIIEYVINTAIKLNATNVYLVYGHNGELLKQYLADKHSSLILIRQIEQHGTGHAIQQVIPILQDDQLVLILYGDVPLISLNTLERLLVAYPEGGISLLTAKLNEPDGYGRIIYDNEQVIGIVEHNDANEQQQRINEVNTGILVTCSKDLKRWIAKLTNTNTLQEFFLTDIIALASKEKQLIHVVHPDRLSEIQGINNCLQLVKLERLYQQEQAEDLLSAGVRIADPTRFELRGKLQHGNDVYIDTNVIIQGKVIIGNRVTICTGCVLKNVVIGNNVVINPYTLIEDAYLAEHSTVGPFAHLRAGSVLQEGAYVGNFVEIKKSSLGKKSKVAHLSYLGDAQIGTKVNIGAGTITCNYDGANKHQTIIGDNVFIGSDSQLVAPLTIGNGATIGAGTTVTHDVASNEMIISRIRQFPILNWQRPIKKY